MNCIKCNVSMFDKPLSRTKPMGQPDAGWMCQDCMRKHEPDLYDSLKSDGDLKVTNDIFEAINHPVDNVQRCSKCGAKEIEANTPRTFYACGSSDYDQIPGTFLQSFTCQDNQKKEAMTKTLDDFSKEFADVIGEYEMKHGGIISVGIATGLFRKLATEYASQQRTEGIREGFEAAREVVIADKNTPEHVKSTTLTALFSSSCTHPTVEDYLNRKQ